MNKENAIEVRSMFKDFKLIYDKPYTLKERLVFWNKTKVGVHNVLKNINLDIKKVETIAFKLISMFELHIYFIPCVISIIPFIKYCKF